MYRKNASNDIYAIYGSSVAQRFAMTIAVGACLGLAWWLLFGGGIESVSARFGWAWTPGDGARRLCLAVMLSIYFVRLLVTQFVFLTKIFGLERGVPDRSMDSVHLSTASNHVRYKSCSL